MQNTLYIVWVVVLFISYQTRNYCQTNYPGPQVHFEDCSNCLTSNYQYNNIDVFNTENIISDFGPRYLSVNTPYDFHGGIDYTITAPYNNPPNDLGYHLIPVVTGTLHKLETYTSSNLKYFVIDGAGSNDYGYLHIFDDTAIPTQIGDMIFDYLNQFQPPLGPIYCIVDTTNRVVYSDCGGMPCTNTHYYVLGTDTIYATNNIANVEARIGVVGTSGNVASHLHLSKYHNLNVSNFVNNDENALDPLEEINHFGPDYTIKLLRDSSVNNIDDYPEGVQLNYPGSQYSDILIRPIMPDTFNGVVNNGNGANTNNSIYFSNTLNIHKIELKLSSFYFQDYLIRGPFYESKFWLGGIVSDSVKYPEHIIVRDPANVGGWNRTGLKPYAYKTGVGGPRRWDDFFFVDFVTRIHKNDPFDQSATPTLISNCPSNSRYIDGTYNLKAVLTDVRGNTQVGPKDTLGNISPEKFVLDNFKPFVEEVKVYIDSSMLVYSGGWSCNDTCIGFSAPSIVTEINPDDINSGLYIVVTASEEMDSISLSVPIYQLEDLVPVTAIGSGVNNLDYVFYIDVSDMNATGDYLVLKIAGVDKNQNELIVFPRTSLKTTCFDVPTRMGATNWNDQNNPSLQYGLDTIHFIYLGCSSLDSLDSHDDIGLRNQSIGVSQLFFTTDPITIQDSIIGETNHTSYDGEIFLSITGGTPPYSYFWEDSNGYNFSINEDVSDLASGEYCVTVSDNFCGYAEECFEVNSRCNEFEVILVSTIPAYGENSSGEAIFFVNSEGIVNLELHDSVGIYNMYYITAGHFSITGLHHGAYEAIFTGLSNGDSCILSISFDIDKSECGFFIDYEIADGCVLLGGYVDIMAYNNDPHLFAYQHNGIGTVYTNTTGYIIVTPGNNINVTITDNTGCSAEYFFTVMDPQLELNLDSVLITPPCVEGIENNGSIILPEPIGFGPFTYNWSNNSNSKNLFNVGPGSYTVSILDALGCQNEVNFNLEGEQPMVYLGNIPSFCPGSLEGGVLTLNCECDFTPCQLDISNGDSFSDTASHTTHMINIDTPGFYCYGYTNSNGCAFYNCINIPISPTIVLDYIQNPVVCNSGTYGAIGINAYGSDPFTYIWSDGSTTPEITELQEGTYTVTVTDFSGCTATQSYSIYCCKVLRPPDYIPMDVFPPIENVDINVNPPSSYHDNDGSVSVSHTYENSSAFNYIWSGPNGFTSSEKDIENIVVGDYYLTITNGCISQSYFIPIRDCNVYEFVTDIQVETPCEFIGPNGELHSSEGYIQVDVNNGIPPIKYTWSSGDSSNKILVDNNTNYSLTLSDLTGCQDTLNFHIGPSGEGITYTSTQNWTMPPYSCTFTQCCGNDCVSISSVELDLLQPGDPFYNSNYPCRAKLYCTYDVEQVYYYVEGEVNCDVITQPADSNYINCIAECYCTYEDVLGNPIRGPVPGTIEDCCDPSEYNEFEFTMVHLNDPQSRCKIQLFCSANPNPDDPFWILEGNLVNHDPQFTVDSINCWEVFTCTYEEIDENVEQFVFSDPINCEFPFTPEVDSSIFVRNTYREQEDNFRVSSFPNPFSQSLTLDVLTDHSSDIAVIITSLMGRVVFKDNVHVKEGNNVYSINTSAFHPGIYILTVSNSHSSIFSSKLFKYE